MIIVDENYFIEVDSYNYSAYEKKTSKKEDGTETEYKSLVGHYSNVFNAIKGILEHRVMKYSSEGEKSLYEVLEHVQTVYREFNSLAERLVDDGK